MNYRIGLIVTELGVFSFGVLLRIIIVIMVFQIPLSVCAQSADTAKFQQLDSTEFFSLKDSLEKVAEANYSYYNDIYLGLTGKDIAEIIRSYRAGFYPDLPEKQAFSNSESHYAEAMATVTFDQILLYIPNKDSLGFFNEVHVICGELEYRE